MNTTLAFGILLLATPAPADSPLDHFRAAMTGIGDPRTTCIDFNGTWTGSCEVTEASSSVHTELRTSRQLSMTFVQQGCATIQAIDFGLVQIGATRSNSTASPRGTASDQSASFWDDDGNLGMTEDMKLVKYEGKGVVYQARSVGSFGITDGTLTATITTTVEEKDLNTGLQTTLVETQACRLSQPD